MTRLRLRLALLLLPLAMPLAAFSCSSEKVQLAVPQPSEAQLQHCPEPKLVPNPDTASDTDLALEKIEVAKYAACERDGFQSLIDWCRRVLLGKGSKP